jgi:hypothetical protein
VCGGTHNSWGSGKGYGGVPGSRAATFGGACYYIRTGPVIELVRVSVH